MNILLEFERSDDHDSGWKEHFFHFLWGYLLPAIREILKLDQKFRNDTVFEMESCGPVMDPLIVEAGTLLRLNIRILLDRNKSSCHCITVPRWDKILRYCLNWHYDNYGSLPAGKDALFIHPSVIPDGNLFYEDINSVKTAFLKNIDMKVSDQYPKALVMKRSEEHPYYKPGGDAIRPTYGNSRRALIGVDEAIKVLWEKGYGIYSFEPGQLSLTEQIRHFYNAETIIGIRGAEFANMIWMKPGSTVVMLEPPYMSTTGVQPLLAGVLGLDFVHIKNNGNSNNIILDPNLIEYLILDLKRNKPISAAKNQTELNESNQLPHSIQSDRHAKVGPADLWEMKRRFQFDFLLAYGLKPTHKLLDFGCGTLRGGIPLIGYLNTGNYTGIDVREDVIREGIRELDEAGLRYKKPVIECCANLSEINFNTSFDRIWAFSVLIHLEDHILRDALGFISRHLSNDGVFFGNVNIDTRNEGSWLEFPVIYRSFDFYKNIFREHQLIVKDLGTLQEFGHHHPRLSQEEQSRQRMLCAVKSL